ncbi:hypothetical protein BMF94_6657 [Rhodotorula taiwanensis]|uniref:RlpA-like protein double-psi beta-barrel domain-containing protein n=1 Tax=Rhodotorula taiwanensis TaxID=741276 RepID=A0A2S5B0T4_9BASI|nr:hypothetical protein BMF94_6657 [Rhodotorula taiwanensis]
MIAPATLFAALAAFAAVEAAPISLATVEASLSTPNSTQTNQKIERYQMNGNAGACGWYNKDSDVVVGLPLEFYSKLDSVSPYCGDFVVVSNPGTNQTVTALVADASTQNNTLSVSDGTFAALKNSTLEYVNWRFANASETAAAKDALTGSDSSSPSVAVSSSSSSSWTAPSSSAAAPSTSAAAASSQDKPSSTWEGEFRLPPRDLLKPPEADFTALFPAPSSSSTSKWVAPTTTTSSWVAPTTTTTQWVAPTTTTSQWVAPTTTQAAKQVSNANSGSYSGQATFYTQGGVAGSCGTVHGDGDYIVAVSASMMNSGLCGKTVQITNTANGKSISATVADTCPGCGYGSLDLSTGAFGALGSYDQGVLPISWSYSS